MSLPADTYLPGWPEFLTDTEDATHVLLRDGSDVAGALGNTCIYGLLTDEGYIDRERQWLPVLGATEEDMRMNPSDWTGNDVLLPAGQPPIRIPDEPVDVPDEGDSRRHILPRRRQDG